ncbi:MAG TPA: hypothetical protein DEG17_24010 [Cyanobacteria bacterium UBA11149]|nr:hypothetical protein [Cyanobacteria bacterium UBA11367]HBE56342.1 hypothetical protein [Cyanobacteria bacterium UBA11366]HBK65035.1 hypothetical protein [Cyanobacteria bacterium UBA11166]HBR76255.1 hypothetical protein [Cyanobacteria bacterium UBA11159]HBS70490.1 hypothetical protein [Cyanobacteria bacterium UBA11153]HBW91846.1 hypothetical protein [Cyanobacteria bacterium UBA11149]HCA94776.1 hypothetical protein [Cyanobacteria bacterium UBA9226]
MRINRFVFFRKQNLRGDINNNGDGALCFANAPYGGRFGVSFRKLRLMLKYLFLALAIILLIIWGQGKLGNLGISPVLASTAPEKLVIQASFLTNEGHRLLALGDNEEALETWQQALDLYEKLGNNEGVIGSRVNQSIALQALGRYRYACQVLLPALNIDTISRKSLEVDSWIYDYFSHWISPVTFRKWYNICDPATEESQIIPEQPHSLISATALRTFGDTLRNIGKLDLSNKALQKSLQIAKDYQSDLDISAALLSLGNTERALYNQAVDKYERNNSGRNERRNEAKMKVEQALEYYRNVTNYPGIQITQIQAKINRLSLLLELNKWLGEEKQDPETEALIPEIESDMASLPDSQITVYTKINFVKILSSLEKKDEAIKSAKDALHQAEMLKDERTKAYAMGTLGSLYEEINNLDNAEKFTTEASNIAQSIQAYDIAYQWEWQLGRIYKKQGQVKGAMPQALREASIAAYDSAVKDLEIVRQDLLSINRDIQFSFQDDVEPLYREFLELLLKENTTSENLKTAIQVTQLLQLAELENFLQCDYSQLESIDKLEKQPDAIIYPIIGEEEDKVKIDVIVELPGLKQLKRHTNIINKTEFDKTLDQLRKRLSDKDNDVNELILPPAQKLYDWIIRPVRDELPDKGTLVFVLDSTLQGIPMTILYDGNEYLIEKYSVAVSFGFQFEDAKPLPSKGWNVLLAGVSEKAKSFTQDTQDLPALPSVKEELNRIRDTVETEEILNQQFTKQALKNQMEATAFPVIHLATHGTFSSNPEDTVIYAWDEKIELKEIDGLLRQRGQISDKPIELIVLSACETAKGDKKAALGIAGVALRARSRSVVASLWTINDNSTASFMAQFYQELNKGMTKAEALQNVQKDFLHNPKYSGYEHPYFWSAFILAGSWL